MLTNKHNLNLAMQVWLIHDTYDYVSDPKYISTTSILKPVKQIILERRYSGNNEGDISDMIASKYGTSIHNGIEDAWTSPKLSENLAKLGIDSDTIDLVRVNPEEHDKEKLNVYLERRSTRELNGWTIGGKFDLVADGQIQDNKSTSTWNFIYGSRVDDYVKQCSIYRWLNTDIVTNDKFIINYVFTDWSKTKARQDSQYPQCRIVSKEYDLLSLEETEALISKKLELIDKYWSVPEEEIPECTDEELWRTPTKYKYYKDPNKLTRATKVFDFETDANSYWKVNNKGVGTVIAVPGSVNRCLYCRCFDHCSQKDKYIQNGSLER